MEPCLHNRVSYLGTVTDRQVIFVWSVDTVSNLRLLHGLDGPLGDSFPDSADCTDVISEQTYCNNIGNNTNKFEAKKQN